MTYIWEGPEPLKRIPINPPKVNFREVVEDDETKYITEINSNIQAKVTSMVDNEIVKAIVDAAAAEGVNDLILIDKDFIISAIKHEIARRKSEVTHD